MHHTLDLEKESDHPANFITLLELADKKLEVLNKRITHEIKVSRELGLPDPFRHSSLLE